MVKLFCSLCNLRYVIYFSLQQHIRQADRRRTFFTFFVAATYFCGGTVGLVAALCTHPLDIVKTRLVVQGMGDPLITKGYKIVLQKSLNPMESLAYTKV